MDRREYREITQKNEGEVENEQKLNSVQEEYDSAVSSLMGLKKQNNQKILELDVVRREYRDITQKIEGAAENDQKNKELIHEIEKNQTNLKNAKLELEKVIKKDNDITKKIFEGQSLLHEIKSQEIQIQNTSVETSPGFKKTKHESGNIDSSFIFTNKEKEFIKDQIGTKQYTKGIIEAAGVVTASLKSKLNIAQKEIETVQKLLEKERKEHIVTKEMLEKLQTKI